MSATQDHKVILVSPGEEATVPEKCIQFSAQLSEEGDRNRLIAFLKSENMQIDRLVHNQPFMLEPTPKDKRIEGEAESLRESKRQLERVDMLKDKIRQLVETPLFVNAELLKHQLIEEEARVLQLVHKQPGVYALLRAAQVNQRRCLRA